MPCPLCSNSNTALFRRDKKRDYYQCSRCGLVFVPQGFHLAPADEKSRYDLHQNDPENTGYRNFLRRLLTPVTQRIKKNAKGLDFGSGPEPVLAKMFKEEGYPVNVYDIFYAPDTEALDASYDFITLSEVAEHLAEPGKVIGELVSILNPGGILALMTQPVVDKSLFDRWHYKNDLTHISFFSESLSMAAETHNCSLRHAERMFSSLKKEMT